MTVDTAPLTARIDRRRLRDYRRSLPSTVRPRLAGVLTRAVVLIAFPLALLVMWLVIIDGTFFADGDWALIAILFPLAIPPVIGVVLLVQAFRRRSGVRSYRLNGFAEANGFTYEPYAPAPPLPGMIFTRPGQSSAFVTDILRRREGYALEIGNHTCTTGSGRSTTTYRWGYAAMRLPIALPHIVLDAHGNNTIGRPRLPIAFAKDQRLSLEGDFDRFFTLYCPEGYEKKDALYLFSPDTMAVFVDEAARLDVELVDDYLFLYFPGQLATLDPALWERLLSAVDALSERLLRWEHWRDDRLQRATDLAGESLIGSGSGRGVARQGRRLSVKEDWWWLLGAAFAVFGLVNLIHDLIVGWLP